MANKKRPPKWRADLDRLIERTLPDPDKGGHGFYVDGEGVRLDLQDGGEDGKRVVALGVDQWNDDCCKVLSGRRVATIIVGLLNEERRKHQKRKEDEQRRLRDADARAEG